MKIRQYLLEMSNKYLRMWREEKWMQVLYIVTDTKTAQPGTIKVVTNVPECLLSAIRLL